MKISKSTDYSKTEAPSFKKGTSPFENPQIEPHESAVPETAGENASNDTTMFTQNKAQPFSKKGSGYGS